MGKQTFALLILATSSHFLSGCAGKSTWNGGDSCTQLSNNRLELSDIDAKIEHLRLDTADSRRSGNAAAISRLESQRESLRYADRRLADHCRPMDYYPLNSKERRIP